MEKDICHLRVPLLLNMYFIRTALVSWNGVNSGQFKFYNGVKHGGVMSPLLFSIYINPLMQNLNNIKVGCYMGDICCNAFAYADDVVILSPTCDALRMMVKICEQYATQFSLSFNPNKCVLIISLDSDVFMDSVCIETYGRTIQNVKSVKNWVT